MPRPREPGDVEAAILQDIAALGPLRHGQSTLAAVAIGLAQQFDLLQDEKISRELRMVWSDLRDMSYLAPPLPAPEVKPAVDTIDELKERRREQEQRKRGEAGA